MEELATMNEARLSFCLLGLLSLLLCLPVNAETAALANKLSNNLYWDDIPHWEHATGKLSKTTINNSDWDAVSLGPGAMVTYRIPRSAFTRIFSEEKKALKKTILSRGDGSGLFTELTSNEKKHYIGNENSSLLLMPENNYWQLLIHNDSNKSIILSVMTSRASEEAPFPPARTLITPTPNHIENQSHWLTTPHLSQHDLFAYNNGDAKTTYSVKGPQLIEVESILLAAGIDETLPSYLITSELDGAPWQQWQHQAALYPFMRRSDNNELVRSTYTEKYLLKIPAGSHTLSFNTLRPIALRIFASQSWGLSSNEDSLYPRLKEQQQEQLDYQDAVNTLTDTLLASPTAAITQILNQWQDKQDPITAAKERVITRSQFYRALAANTSRPPLQLFNLKPVVAKYTSIQNHPDVIDNSSADSNLETGLEPDLESLEQTQTSSIFNQLVEKDLLTFSLPDRSGPSKLRVRLAGLRQQPAQFLLSNQQGQKHSLFYYPKFRSKLLNASNHSLEKDEVSIAEAFIPLSIETKTITIQTVSGTTSKLQLAYLMGKQLGLQPAELMQAIRQLETESDNSIIAYLQGKYVPNEARADYHLLQSSLADLAHRIQIRSQQFEQTSLNTVSPLIIKPVVANKWKKTVKKLIDKKEWAAAIDIVSPLSRHKNSSIRNAAAKFQADILLAAGEFILYQQWLLKLLTSPAYADLSGYAESSLIDRYKKLEQWTALEKLSAYRFMQSADIAYLELIAASLTSESSLPLKQQLALIHQVLNAEQISVQPVLADSPILWQPLQTDRLSAASSGLMHGHDFDNYSARYTANPSQALEFTIEGPTVLAISYRTLLSKGTAQSPYSWLTLRDNQQTHYIPTFQSALSNSVSIIGENRQVSGEQSIEYQLGVGSHQIHIRPELGDLVIGLSTRASTVNEDATLTMLSQGEIDIELNTLSKIRTFKQQQAHIHPVKSLLQLLWASEHSPKQALPLIALGNAIIEQYPNSPLLNRLNTRLNQFSGWQLEQQLIDSAGKRSITFNTAPESNPKTRIRNSLNRPDIESGQWLSAHSDLSFNISSTTPVALKLQLKQLSLLNGYTEGASIQLWLNKQLYRTISLTNNRPFKSLILNLKAGDQQLRIAMKDAKSDQKVLFRGSRKAPNKPWQLINMPAKQAYAVSLKDNPVTVFAAASEWLRIDDLINGQVQRSYHYQEENGTLDLLPKSGQSERLLRVYKLRLKPYLTDLASSSAPNNLAKKISYPFTPQVKSWQLVDHLELSEENEGTWGGYLKLSNQGFSDDPEDDITSSMNAIQLGHIYRKKTSDDHYWSSTTGDWQSNAYWKSDTFIRSLNTNSDNNGNTLGTDQRLIMTDPETDWQFSLNAKALYFQTASDLSDNVLHAYTEAQYRHNWQFNRRQTLDASLTGFARYLDNKSPRTANNIDPLVYSDYKRDHTYGWRLAGNWRYRLWHDSRWNIGTQLISNESLLTLDQASLQTGYQQYFKGLTAAVSLRHVQRFADDDRRVKSFNNIIKGSLRFHQWNAKGNEWYFGLNLEHDISIEESAAVLTFGFNHSDGRGVRDYLPTELPMRDLYQQQSTQQQTMNTLSDKSSL
ncbi:MAG: hypothetical protein ACI978_001608 [Oleispira sp.]